MIRRRPAASTTLWQKCPRCLEWFPAGPPIPHHLRETDDEEVDLPRYVPCATHVDTRPVPKSTTRSILP